MPKTAKNLRLDFFKTSEVWGGTSAHRSCFHKLPPSRGRIMKPKKDWHTVNEDTLQRAAAAWVWLHTYIRGRGSGLPHCTTLGNAMMSKWVPLNERSKFVTLIASGAQFGTVISLPISGVMAADINWQSVFYFFGALGCVWFIFWAFFIFSTPQTHPRISREELHYIESNILRTRTEELPFPPVR